MKHRTAALVVLALATAGLTPAVAAGSRGDQPCPPGTDDSDYCDHGHGHHHHHHHHPPPPGWFTISATGWAADTAP
jgi:hypothetical protein